MSKTEELVGSLRVFGEFLDAHAAARWCVCALLVVLMGLLTLNAMDNVIGAGERRIAPVKWLAEHTGMWSKDPPRLDFRGGKRYSRGGLGISPGPATRVYGCMQLALVAGLGGVLLSAASARRREFGFGVLVWSLFGALALAIMTGLASFAM